MAGSAWGTDGGAISAAAGTPVHSAKEERTVDACLETIAPSNVSRLMPLN